MFNPIQPNPQSTLLPLDAFPGQKLERSQDVPRPVVDRKQETPSAREEIPREQVEKAAEKLNRLLGAGGKRRKFRVHGQGKGLRIKVVDPQSGAVLDEITPERLLAMSDSPHQMAGMLFDQEV